MPRLKWSLFGTAAVLSLAAMPAFADETATDSSVQTETEAPPPAAQSGLRLENVLVTAQKREEDIQDVTAAITALSEDTLDRLGIQDIDNLQYQVPGLNFAAFQAQPQITIRGAGSANLGPGGDSSAAIHVDGTYLSRAGAALAENYDVQRIEVLRGPQGTLYGRNSTAGAINIISNEPTSEMSIKGDVTFGNYQRKRGRAAVNIPLVEDKLMLRVAGAVEQRDGYIDNLYDGGSLDDADYSWIRGQLLYKPTENTDILLKYWTYSSDETGAIRQEQGGFGPVLPLYAGGTPVDTGSDLTVVSHDSIDKELVDIDQIALNITSEVNGYILKSITSYIDNSYATQDSDLDHSEFHLSYGGRTDDSTQTSQEFQIISPADSRLRWLAGAFYFKEKTDSDYDITLSSLVRQYSSETGKYETEAYAAFGEVAYDLTDTLTATIGARYSYEEKYVFAPRIINYLGTPIPGNLDPASGDWDSFTPKFVLQYAPRENLMLYASATQGFKSGGFGTSGFASPVKPEEVTAYEIGMKSEFPSYNTRLNATVFMQDFKDMQVFRQLAAGFLFENAAEASSDGAEIELFVSPAEGLTLNASLSYLDATFDDFVTEDPLAPGVSVQLAGNRLPRSPEFTFSTGANYVFDVAGVGTFTPSINYYWQDEVWYTEFNEAHPVAGQGSFGKVDISLLYETEDDTWFLEFFGKNVTDEHTISNSFSAVWDDEFAFAAPPATYGVRLGFRYE